MSTQYERNESFDGRFDVLYMAACRQHTEALRRADMERLAQSIVRCRLEGAGSEGRMAAAVRRVADVITRKGRSAAVGTDS